MLIEIPDEDLFSYINDVENNNVALSSAVYAQVSHEVELKFENAIQEAIDNAFATLEDAFDLDCQEPIDSMIDTYKEQLVHECTKVLCSMNKKED